MHTATYTWTTGVSMQFAINRTAKERWTLVYLPVAEYENATEQELWQALTTACSWFLFGKQVTVN